MKKFTIALLLGSLVCASNLRADHEEGHVEEEKAPFVLGAYVGANILSAFIGSGGTTSNRIGFGSGVDGSYFFSNAVGVLVGLQAHTRGFLATNGLTASTWFLDIPFGFVFRYNTAMFGAGSENMFSLGAYYSQPLGDFSAGGATSSADGALGLYGLNKTLFPVTETFRLGFASWVKFGLTSSRKTSNAGNLIEFGLGLAAEF